MNWRSLCNAKAASQRNLEMNLVGKVKRAKGLMIGSREVRTRTQVTTLIAKWGGSF